MRYAVNRLFVIAVAGLLAACSGATTPSGPSPTIAPSPTAIAAATFEPTAAPAPTPTAQPQLLLGEQWIAFQSDAGGGIYGIRLVRADGTGLFFPPAAAEIGGSPQLHPEWSPDGNRMVFSAQGSVSTNLWIIDLTTNESKLIVDCSVGCSLADEPAWSRDGKTIAFHRQALNDGGWVSTLELYDVAEGTSRVVMQSADDRMFFQPRWSPDGSMIVAEYVHRAATRGEDTIDGGQLVIVDVTATKPKARVLTGPEYWPQNSDWSPDGKSIVFCRTDDPATVEGPIDLWTIRPDGTGLKRLTHLAENGGGAIQPAYSSDGSRIVFIAFGPETGDSVMATVAADGSDLQPATSSGYMDGFHPRLRPTP
jgi:Tol biopolymer transport system component